MINHTNDTQIIILAEAKRLVKKYKNYKTRKKNRTVLASVFCKISGTDKKTKSYFLNKFQDLSLKMDKKVFQNSYSHVQANQEFVNLAHVIRELNEADFNKLPKLAHAFKVGLDPHARCNPLANGSFSRKKTWLAAKN